MNRILKIAVMFSLAVIPFAAMAQGEKPILLREGKPNPQNVKCDEIISAEANGSIRYKDGSAQLLLPAKDLVYVFSPRKKCQELVDADAAVKGGKWSDAYEKLKAGEKYSKLGWDANIIYLQGLALSKMNRKPDAIKILDKIRSLPEQTRHTAWKKTDIDNALSLLVLLASDAGDAEMVQSITEFIVKSKSSAMPSALIAAGDLLTAKGQKRDAVYKYLAAGLLYEKSPEAARGLCMAANLMKELGDARGERIAQTLKEKYAGNEWVSKLK